MEKLLSDVSNDDVKAEFDKINDVDELGGTPSDSSTDEKPTGAPAAEAVKSETPADDQEVTESVPYARFKEVNDKIKELEEYKELYEQNKQYIRVNPETGRKEVFIPEESAPRKVQEEDQGLELNEEEQFAFDNVQQGVVSKIVQRTLTNIFKQQREVAQFQSEIKTNWDNAVKEFPEVSNKDSALYKKAQTILQTKYTQKLGEGKFYTPPHAHYTAVLEAKVLLDREAASKTKVVVEEKKNQKQQVFVSKKGDAQPAGKKKLTEKELQGLSREDLDRQLEEEFYALNPDSRTD